MRVAFVGTALEIAASLAAAGHRLVALVARPPASPGPCGWRQTVRARLRRGPVERLRAQLGAPEIRATCEAEWVERLLSRAPDVVVCAGWPSRLPSELTVRPPLGAINVHPSRLPRHRGPDPVYWTVRAGERCSAVSFHRMTDALDAGPVVEQVSFDVLQEDTKGSVLQRAIAIACAHAPSVLERLADGTDPRIEQDETQASHEPRPSASDLILDPGWPAARLHDRIRARLPDRPVWVHAGAFRARLLGSIPDSTTHRVTPGQLIGRAGPFVRLACGEGSSLLVRLERPLPTRVREITLR
ncbi:MAG: hypothetical protein NZ898_15885 [Myxococcota bacterium]|nr:hypothetical protein [Myxococcota bacterium]